MGNKLRRIFNPTPEEQKKDLEFIKKIHNELKKDKNCNTCKNKVHIISYPGFITGEEWECTKGLKCETIFCSIKNCPKWEDNWEE